MTDSGLTISLASPEERPIMTNLMTYYVYDMSEWFDIKPDLLGVYSYEIEGLWTDRFQVYIARKDRLPIGFALVEKKEDLHDLRAFFIARSHRRGRLGQALCNFVLNTHRGQWQVRVINANRPALPFWKRVVSDYTKGAFTKTDTTIDDTLWTHYHFQSTS